MKPFFLIASILLVNFSALISDNLTSNKIERPNILWIYLEDVSRWFGCYGDDAANTPNIDRLAQRGTRFDRYYTTAGVCSSSRSAVITGMMQTSIGAHNHVSNRGQNIEGYIDEHSLPKNMKTIPEYFRKRGYFTFNDGKDDFNFTWKREDLYDDYGKMNFQGDEWAKVPKGKPFFGQIQLWGGKDKVVYGPELKMDRNKVKVPSYYPDLPEVREDIADHYDCIRKTDEQVGMIVKQLEDEKLLHKTIIVLISDHGFKLHRDKQYLYEGAIKMPLIIAGPGIESGRVNDDLISGIDVGPTSLQLAGFEVPAHMEGQSIYAKNYRPRDHIVAAKDRCGIAIDRVRAIVTSQYKYLKNFMTDRSYMQPTYKESWPSTLAIRKWMAEDEMTEAQKGFFGPDRPAEELYDLEKDPEEIHNLAKDPNYAELLEQYRVRLETWMLHSDDQGRYPEKPAGLLAVLYDYGDKAVNPEYAAVKTLLKSEALVKKKTVKK